MIPLNTFDIVFNIRVNSSSSGTCFTVPHDKKKYLITARHILPNIEQSQLFIEIETKKGWIKIDFENLIFPKTPSVDIVAIQLPNTIPDGVRFVTFDYTTEGIKLLEDAFFLGYPYGLKNYGINNGRGNALVKKGLISGDAYDDNSTFIGFILDGHNNPGFSGGPVLTKGSDGRWKIFAVISSYITQQEILYDKDQRERMILKENSGLINCHSIDFIIKELL